MKITKLLEGTITNLGDVRAKKQADKDAELYDQISQQIADDPDGMALPTFAGHTTAPTRKEFPRKIVQQILDSAIPAQIRPQLNDVQFHVQRRMCDGVRVMDISASIKVKGFVPVEIYDVHPMAGNLFKSAVSQLLNQMGSMVEKGQFTGSTSVTLILK